MQPFPHPNDGSDKIWLRLAHWLRRYSSLKMFTDARTDARHRYTKSSALSLWLWCQSRALTLLQICRNSNSSKLSCMSSIPARMKKIQLKMKALECSQDFSHYKSMGIFPGAQGQLTPQSLVRSGRVSNSSEMLWMSSLPASMKKIRSKMKALEWTQHYTAIFQTRKGR